jgi:hypothetical protein
MDTKEKFPVQQNCPIDYFANKVKTYAPNFAKTEKVQRDNREVTVYPAFGRTTWRVLYNAAWFDNLGAGIHLLDLPQSGGASVIDEYVRGKQPDGSDNPLINDYKAAIPVFIKLDLTAKGQPWKISVKDGKTYELDDQFADTDYLYNLDEQIVYPSKDELIEKLRMVVPSDLFNKCMAGYSDGSVKVSFNTPVSAPKAEDDVPFDPPVPSNPTRLAAPANMPKASVPAAAKPTATSVAPAFNLPKAVKPAAAPVVEPQAEEVVDDDEGLPTPPVAAASSATLAKARDFLKRSQA